MDWCAAVPQQSHDIGSLIQQALMNGGVMAGILFMLFRVQERYKSGSRRSEYARSIFLELDRMRERLWPESGERESPRPDYDLVYELPRSRYDGLVSSAAIASLSGRLQQRLDDFYGLLHEGRIDIVERSILDLMIEVQKEKKDGECWWRFWKRRA